MDKRLAWLIRQIRPPLRLCSLADVENIFSDPSRLSLCEYEVFQILAELHMALERNHINGDYVQVGVWRGGTALWLRGLIELGGMPRRLWLIDTFEGFAGAPLADHERDHAIYPLVDDFGDLMPTLSEVRGAFSQVGLTDQGVLWRARDIRHADSDIAAEAIALLHIDVDFYETTWAALSRFYDRVVEGGVIMVDDYGASCFDCKKAVDSFRYALGLRSSLQRVGQYGVWWRKGST